MLLPNLLRRAQPLVGARGRHLDVHDRDVGLVRANLQQQILRRSALPDDLEARLLEQARDALAEQHRVVGENDADPRRLAFFQVCGSVVDDASVAENRTGDKQRRPQRAGASKASIADADSSAFGRKPSAGLPATRAPKSAPSRLDVRRTAAGTASCVTHLATSNP